MILWNILLPFQTLYNKGMSWDKIANEDDTLSPSNEVKMVVYSLLGAQLHMRLCKDNFENNSYIVLTSVQLQILD